MIFHLDMAFGLELLALVAGTSLMLFACKEGATCKVFAKVVAIFTIVTSILGMLCTVYYGLRYWEDGYFKAPAITHTQQDGMGMMPMGGPGMGNMMNSPMMQDMMKKGMNQEEHH